MRSGILRRISRTTSLWLCAAALLLILATPALSTIFAAPGSVNTKAIVRGAVTSAKIKNGTIKNADIAAAANIASGKINWPARTKKYSVPPAAWQAYQNTDMVVREPAGAYITSEWAMVAPVNLPDGAVINHIDLYYNDTASTTADDLYIDFYRHDLSTNGYATLAEIASNAGLGRGVRGADITPNVTVANGSNVYYVHASHTGPTRRVEAVVITYTITGP